MKKIYSKWFSNGTKCFQIIDYKKSWKEYGNPPMFKFRTNGAKRKNGDSCLDVTLIIGCLNINYTDFDLQGAAKNKIRNMKNNG